MKRRGLIWFTIAAVLLGMLFFSGCAAKAAIADSKDLLTEYYDDYSDEDASDMISVMHEDLIDDLGSEEEIEIRLQARRALLGDIDEYTFGSVSFETSNGTTQVSVTVDASYENGESMEEKFVFTTDGDELMMTGISLPKEAAVDEMAGDFLDVLDDPAKMKGMYVPAVQSPELEDTLANISDALYASGGAYDGYELTSQEYHYMDLGDMDAKYVYSATYNLEFSNFDALCELQMSVEDGELGINNFKVTPRIVMGMCEDLYNAISHKEIEEAADLYSTLFYDATTGGRDAWIAGVLDPLANDYGKFVNYTIVNWAFEQTDLPDGTTADTFSVTVYSQYESLNLGELIKISYDESGNYQILSHQLEVQE